MYSLAVLLYEWLLLEHPLKDKKTVTEVLAAIVSGDGMADIGVRAVFGGVPAEWVNVIVKGLVRDPKKRFQSVAEFESALKAVFDGKVKVECHVSLAKRVAHEILHWIDSHPRGYFVLFHATLALAGLAVLAGLGFGGYRLIHALK